MKIALAVLALVALAFGLSWLSGCAARNAQANPLAVNQPVNTFESYAYQVLEDAQAGLAETDAQIKAGTLPKSVIPDYDRAAVVYNTARALLSRYDQTYRAGGDVTSLQLELAQDLQDIFSLGLKLWPNKITTPAPPKS